jgi:hypothetical protein
MWNVEKLQAAHMAFLGKSPNEVFDEASASHPLPTAPPSAGGARKTTFEKSRAERQAQAEFQKMEHVLRFMSKFLVRRCWRKWFRPEERLANQQKVHRVYRFLQHKDFGEKVGRFRRWRNEANDVRESRAKIKHAGYRILGNKQALCFLLWRSTAEDGRRVLLLAMRAARCCTFPSSHPTTDILLLLR